MRHPFNITPARHQHGLNLYRHGATIRDLCAKLAEIEQMHEAPDLSNEKHDEISEAGPSVIAGFMDGLLDDVRRIAQSPSLTQRGMTA